MQPAARLVYGRNGKPLRYYDNVCEADFASSSHRLKRLFLVHIKKCSDMHAESARCLNKKSRACCYRAIILERYCRFESEPIIYR